MNYKQFQNNKKSKDVFLKYLIAKMDRSDLSEKERKLMHELQNSHNERDFDNKLSSAQLKKASERNAKVIFDKIGLEVPLKEKRVVYPYFIVGSVAAIALIILTIGVFNSLRFNDNSFEHMVLKYDLNHQISSDSTIKKVTLADGSIIFMNNETKISIREGKFNAFTREIWLEEGEAFFEIKRDSSRPFIIHSPNGVTTKVLGTSFNIRSYGELTNQVISVNTGRVQVFKADNESIVLDPNYKVSISYDDGELISSKSDAKKISDWRTGNIIFENASIEEFAFRLKQYYNVELVYDSNQYSNELINSSFNIDTPLEEVLSVLAKLVNSGYKEDNGKIQLKK